MRLQRNVLLQAYRQGPTNFLGSAEDCSLGGFRRGYICFARLWLMRNLRANLPGGTATFDQPQSTHAHLLDLAWGFTCWFNGMCFVDDWAHMRTTNRLPLRDVSKAYWSVVQLRTAHYSDLSSLFISPILVSFRVHTRSKYKCDIIKQNGSG